MGPVEAATRIVEKVHFVKRFKVLENESIFQNIKIFLAHKNSFFPKKNLDKLNKFYKYFVIFSKNYVDSFKVFNFIDPLYIPREIPE